MKPRLKYLLIFALIAAVLGTVYFLNHYNHDHSEEANSNHIYTCPMHPQIIRNEPGNCPICGMTLVKKTVDSSDTQSDDMKHLLKRTDNFVTGNFEITSPIDTVISTTLELPGYIEYDPKSSVSISARVNGRIEKMYVNYKFQRISKGQRLFDLYSPELLTEQQNFIYLLNNDAENMSIINASKQKLMLYGMTSTQIGRLSKLKKVNPLITIYSPTNGIVTGTAQMQETVSQPMQENTSGTTALTIREGDYITKGQTVFQLVNTDRVWGIFNILPGFGSLIKVNQPLSFTTELDRNKTFQSRVGFVETQFTDTDKSNRIRVYINNTDHFPIGLHLQGKIETVPVSGTWIQKQSQISIGNDKVVFVKSKKGFSARKTALGLTLGNYIQVISGVTVTDTIVRNAQYLIDSESFIKTE